MPVEPSYYPSGELILPGDRIQLAGRAGRVVFVLGRDDTPADWRYLEADHESGYMLDVEGMGYVFGCDVDEDLDLIARELE